MKAPASQSSKVAQTPAASRALEAARPIEVLPRESLNGHGPAKSKVRTSATTRAARSEVEVKPIAKWLASMPAPVQTVGTWLLSGFCWTRNRAWWVLRWCKHWVVWSLRWLRHGAIIGMRWARHPVRANPLIRPRLGRLVHHRPRPLRLPAHYRTGPLPTDPPRISIVTPSFNQAHMIERTIRSVLDQDYPGLEYIVQDGGSRDGTVELLERYGDALHYWESGPDEGQTNAINRGFRHATGEIMAYLNSDDLLLPGALRVVGRYFREHPDVDAVYGHRVLIDEQDREIGRWILPQHDDRVLSWADYIPQETLFWRRSAWERVGGGFDESFHFAMDWDFLLRLRDAGARFVRLPRFLGAFRIHDRQKTTASMSAVGAHEMARLRQRTLGRTPPPEEVHLQVMPYLVRHLACHYLFAAGLKRY